MSGSRDYPDRPYLAVSAAILRDGKLLIVRRRNKPAQGLFTLPGGVVEAGETLHEAVAREVKEELGIICEAVAMLGRHVEAIMRDGAGKVRGHFVILPFLARYIDGEIVLNDELSEARWIDRAELAELDTTDGLEEIVTAAFALAG